MSEVDWKDACKKLQEKGLKFDFYSQIQGRWFSDKPWIFTDGGAFRIAAQPIPDREDWRAWCRKLQDCGVVFEYNAWVWVSKECDFIASIEAYRIAAQPIPAGITKYLESEMAEQKQNKPEIHHLEQQIQWHEDKLRSLRTGEPMREWEYRLAVGDGEWKICNDPHFSEKYEYRRKPRTVTYWHCVFKDDNGNVFPKASVLSKEDLRNYMERHYKRYKKSQIIETTVELED